MSILFEDTVPMAGEICSAAKGAQYMKNRRIIGNILLILAVLFTAYLTAVMLHRISTVVLKDVYREAFQYELIFCAAFLLFALDVRFGLFTAMRSPVLKAVGWVLRIAVILFVAVLLFFFGRITINSLQDTDEAAEHVLVLGLALEHGKPTADLLSRLNTAEDYLLAHPESTLILTGGNPDANGNTEADVMRAILQDRGVPADRMIEEDKAASTIENFQNAARLIDPSAPTILITSDYHMHRAMQTAETAGFTNILPLTAPSSPLFYAANVTWEVLMEINELTMKKR